MFKKLWIILSACVLMTILIACRANNEDVENETYTHYEDPKPTPEELRAEFELFFAENKESIIETIATEGEDVRLELANGYEFIMTILLDDIELNDQNRSIYILTFELTFSQMTGLFGGLAYEIKEAAKIDYFRLTVVFIDANEVEIARSNFDAGQIPIPTIELDENGNIGEVNEETD